MDAKEIVEGALFQFPEWHGGPGVTREIKFVGNDGPTNDSRYVITMVP